MDFIQEIFINKHKFNVLLLDHHITGLDVSQKYPEWYILNKNICSAKITQEYFNVSSLQDFAEYVNVQDLWYDQHHFFSKAIFRFVCGLRKQSAVLNKSWSGRCGGNHQQGRAR